MKEFYNLRWYIQHLVDENEYQYDDSEWTNSLSESNWSFQTNKIFLKYVNFTLKNGSRTNEAESYHSSSQSKT